MNAARAHRLSPFVHAVDVNGALCKARPRAGRWIPTDLLPITCPRCLHRLSRGRWATCELVTASLASRIHIRRVGPEGLARSGNPSAAKTLCGQIAGWDIAELDALERAALKKIPTLCLSCERIAVEPHLADVRDRVA